MFYTWFYKFSQVNKGTEDIKEQFSSFLTQATARFQKIEDDFAEVEKLRKTVAKYIVEDENKFKLEDCFSTISNFCNQVRWTLTIKMIPKNYWRNYVIKKITVKSQVQY